MHKDITGIILSGGKSSRMGQNKSHLMLNGKTVIERIIDLMESIFRENILITNEPGQYNLQGIAKYTDIFTYMGPLAGIHSGLSHSTTSKNFIISCDIPLITTEAIEFIYNYQSDKSIIIPKAGGFEHHLCGIYNSSCIGLTEEILKSNKEIETRDPHQHKRKCKVHELIHAVGAEIIDMELEYPGYNEDLFFNMNSPEDFEYVKKKII